MRLFKRVYRFLWRKGRVFHYRVLSAARFTGTAPDQFQPVLFQGEGRIEFEGRCSFGVQTSAAFHTTYAYIEARGKESRVVFGKGSWFNNNFQVIAAGATVTLGGNLRVGMNCQIISSDFHNVEPHLRDVPPFPAKNVIIGNNIYIGNNVIILKGVTIGDNSVIGSGSVVTSDIPANCVAAGVPARIIKQLSV